MRLSRLGWRINNGKCVRSVRRPGLFKSEPVGTFKEAELFEF